MKTVAEELEEIDAILDEFQVFETDEFGNVMDRVTRLRVCFQEDQDYDAAYDEKYHTLERENQKQWAEIFNLKRQIEVCETQTDVRIARALRHLNTQIEGLQAENEVLRQEGIKVR